MCGSTKGRDGELFSDEEEDLVILKIIEREQFRVKEKASKAMKGN